MCILVDISLLQMSFSPFETVNQFIVSLPHDILEYQFFVQTCIILFSFNIHKKKNGVQNGNTNVMLVLYIVSSKNCSFHATQNCVLTLLLVLYIC
jgi:hypothetical protein